MNKYPILQSGFISLIEAGFVRANRHVDMIVTNILSKDYRDTSNNLFYHEEVVHVYTDWLANPSLTKEFDFRERVYLAAKHAFGTRSLYDWLKAQTSNPHLTSLHKTFITETLLYVLAYDKRNIEVNQWVGLLVYDTKCKSIALDINTLIEKDLAKAVVSNASGDLNAVIRQWVGHPGGIEDLIISLFVIFGNRPYITDVAEKPKRAG